MEDATIQNLLTIPAMLTFVLILIRVSGIFVSAPLLSGRGIPGRVKIAISVGMALILYPLHVKTPGFVVPTDLLGFTVVGFQELVIGLLIGYAAELLFTGIRMSGEYLAVQMGLSISSVLDPVSGTQTAVLGQFYFLFAFILFLILNVHHALIAGLEKSFYWIPLGQGITNWAVLAEKFMMLTADMFKVSLLVGLPVMGVLLVTEISMAFMAKVMPQMNIFIVGLPLKAVIGMLVVMATLPFMVGFLSDQYTELVQHVLGLYKHV